MKNFLRLFFLFFCLFLFLSDNLTAQPPCGGVFNTIIPDNNPFGLQSQISNSGSVGNIGAGTDIISVCLLIEHPFLSDLSISLSCPSGQSIVLSSNNGGTSDNYGNVAGNVEVCFTPSAIPSITTYSGGSVGNFSPEGNFASFNGCTANGNWTLDIIDGVASDAGTLISWSMLFSTGNCQPVCNADAGTITTSTGSNAITLCIGESVTLTSDDNYVLPPAFPGETSELMYFIYNCVPPANPDPSVDVCFSGAAHFAEDLLPTDLGGTNTDGGIPTIFLLNGVTGTNNTLWYVPITVDDSDNNGDPNGFVWHDQDGDLCYDTGTPIAVTYLDDVVVTFVDNCDPVTFMGSVDFTISGGAPANGSGNFTITNTGDGVLAPTTVADGGTFSITGLTDQDMVSFTVSDANCTYGPFTLTFICGSDACLINSNLTASPLPTSFPNNQYPPNTTVTFCFDITQYNQTALNFLAGIVPSFGGGWDPASITPTVNPSVAANNEAGSSWSWFPGNTVDYNATGTLIPDAGWWFLSVNSPGGLPTDPDNSWGDGCTAPGCLVQPIGGFGYMWNACFQLTTVDETACTANQTVSVAVKTYADGETGAWTDPGCTVDQAVTFNATICCIPAPVITAQPDVCNGSSVTLTATPGNGGAINWYSAPTGGLPLASGTPTLSLGALPPGTYTYYAEENQSGCLSLNRDVVTFSVLPLATLFINSGDANICVGESSTITTTVTNAASLTWSSVPGGALPAFNGMDDITVSPTVTTTYTISVTNSCSNLSESFTVNVHPIPTLSSSITDASCMGICDGSISVFPSGGTSPYTYNWSNGLSTSVINGLCSGNYIVTLTDANSCSSTASYNVGEIGVLVVDQIFFTNELCDMMNGTATITAMGGTFPHTYNWSNGQTTQTATGLSAGTYTVTITDANAIISTNLVYSEPFNFATSWILNTPTGTNDLDANFWQVNDQEGGVPPAPDPAGCGVAGNGDMTLHITATSPLIQGAAYNPGGLCLPPFNFCVTANTRAESQNISTIGQTGLTLNFDFISNGDGLTDNASLLYSTNGGASFNVLDPSIKSNVCAGGQGEWASAFYALPATTENIANLRLGFNWTNNDDGNGGFPSVAVNNVRIISTSVSGGCSVVGTVTVFELNGPVINDVIVVDEDCTSPGSLTIDASGGIPVIMYSIGGAFQASNTFPGLSAGNYSITVSDNNGCTATTTATVGLSGSLSVNPSINNNVSCNGQSNGSATSAPSGGTVPYTFNWDNGETTATATGLNAGSHAITVTDTNGCTGTASVSITQPTAITSSAMVTSDFNGEDISCNGASDGEATVTPGGGTPPYTYLWNDGGSQTTTVATGLSSGTYIVTVTDFNNCTSTSSVVLNDPPVLTASASVTSNYNGEDISCAGANDGEATVTPGGGNPPYVFLWNDAGAQTTAIATGLSPGTYNVTVTDFNNCTSTSSVVLNDPPVLTSSAMVTSDFNGEDISCNGANDGEATVTPGGGNPPYTYLWNDGGAQTTTVATGLTSGTYIVTVTDFNNCTSTTSVVLNDPPVLTSSAMVTSDFNGEDISCNGASDGEATVTPGGGNPPYTFLWNDAGAQTSTVATGLSAGTFIVSVTDFNGCLSTASVTVAEPAILAVNVDGNTPANCTSCDGTASITVSGGTAPFTYLWSNGNTDEDPIDLCSGANVVTVTDMNGCVTTAATSIGNVSTLTIDNTIADNNVSCNGQNDGQATVIVSGGQPVYNYIWSNGSTNATATGLGNGIATVTVIDQDGCIATDNVFISEPQNLAALIMVLSDVSCNSFSDGNAQTFINGGTMPYTFLWDNGVTVATATNLNAGNHTVTVTDANMCTTTATTNINEPPLLTASASVNNDISCNGDSNGSATATGAGGSPAYTFQWDNGTTTATATNLNAGNHTVTVTDANMCTATAAVNIIEPPLLSASASLNNNVSCNGDADGSATATGSGGTPAYTYQWDNGETTMTATGLNGGVHLVTITDASMCIATANISVSEPPALTANAVLVSNASCNGVSDGVASASGSGGTPAYTYLWDNGETASTVTNLNAGNHAVTITDANMCSATASVLISAPSALTANAVLGSDVSCNGGSDGSATASGSGGTPAYTYLWDNGETSSTVTNLNAGNHAVTITDANMCSATASILISEPSALTANAVMVTSVTCNGASDGSATASGSGGSPAYTFLWDNGETNATAIALNGGNHTVTVTDSGMCTATASVTITQPSQVTASASPVSGVSCNGVNDGSATASGSGGTAPYTFSWDNSETTATATALSGGNHTVTVTDAMACFATASVMINEPATLSALTSVISDVSCNGFNNGSAMVSGLGGTMPYTFLWDNSETTAQASSLSAGPHTVTVTDTNNCTATGSVNINQPPVLTAMAVVISDVNCAGGSDGSASASGSGGTLPYTFAWDNGETTSLATALGGGPHTLTVTDGNSCSATANVVLSEPGPLNASAVLNNDVSCNGAGDGSATASGSGGSPAYTFLWDNGETSAIANMLSGGNHMVTVTDANSCSETAGVMINEPAVLTANAGLVSDVSCNGVADGSASASGGGGSLPYTFNWDSGETSSTATNLSGGTHVVTVTDSNNCSETASVNIGEPSLLTANANLISDVSCNGANDGSAGVTAAGGTLPYTFLWDSGETTATATALDGNTHIVTVTDANSCVETASITISEPMAIAIVIAVNSQVSCNGQSDGIATATVMGGTAAYTFSWDSGSTDATATNLNAGTHVLTLTDANNCTSTSSVIITEPSLLTAGTTFINDVSCNGFSDGSASVSANGGTNPYTYNWDNGESTSTATNLAFGNHDVTVTDSNGCVATSSIGINEPTAILLTVNGTTAANCTSCDGTADITTAGGTPPYTFLWSNGNTSEDPADLCSGSNNVTVTDMNGCQQTATASVGNTSTLIIDNTTIDSNVSCNGLSDGSATVTVSGGQVPYTYNWTNGSTTTIATGLSSGNYTVTVTDFDGCIAVDNITITQPAALTSNALEDQAVDCNGAPTGQASVSGTGGTLPYTYQWSGGQSDAVITGLTAGNYDATVTDSNGCTSTTSVNITEPPALTASSVEDQPVSCNGLSDGTATATGTGGTMPYTFLWDSGSTDATAINLNAGNHTVTVTDANSCTTTSTVNINEPAALSASAVEDQPVSCTGISDGVATVTVLGGTAAYTYAWDSGSTDATATNLNAGIHSVTVSDANSCSQTAQVTINEPTALNLNINTSSDANCTSCDGTADVGVMGGTVPYTFQWSNGNTNEDPADLCSGLNSLTVTDANGCSETIDVAIGNVSTLVIDNITADNHVSCNGLSDGSASVSVSGGQMPYTYAWDNGDTDASATGLNAGNFGVTVLDADGCISTSSVTITEPAVLSVLANVVGSVSCAGFSDGSAEALAFGGTMPYTYNWSSGETVSTATQLPAGINNVTVTDVNGCAETAQVNIAEPPALSVTVDGTTAANCTSCDGSATLTVGGGVPPYTYNWSNGNTIEDPSDLCSGNSTVTVTDANGCIISATAVISNTSTLLIDNTTVDNHVSCNGQSDGQATVSVSGGQVPYTYSWSNGTTDASATGLGGGLFDITVVDADGCIATDNVVIIDPAQLNVMVNVINDVSCNGLSDGSAEAVVIGGTMPYTFSWDNGATDATATNLMAGMNIITVTDANACFTTASVDIAEPSLVAISVGATTDANCTSCDGTADISISGGTSPYIYVWSNGNTAEDPDDLCSGSNSVTVTDANGCTTTTAVPIGNMSTLVISSTSVDNDVSCNGFSDGQATTVVTGGQMPYTYIWDSGATDATATGLGGGNIGVTVSDADGCVAVDNVTITDPLALMSAANIVSNISCAGTSDGSAEIMASGGSMPYTYLWSNGETDVIATMLGTGVIGTTVTDANGCTIEDSFFFPEPNPVTLSFSTTTASCFNNDGTATAIPSGGTSPYNYIWDVSAFGQTTATATGLPVGSYDVTVSDTNGCSVVGTAIIADGCFCDLAISLTTTPVSCNGDTDGTATANASLGTPPYNYIWNDGQTDATATGLTPGSYTVTVSDSGGCNETGTITVTEPSLLTSSAVDDQPVSCNGGSDGISTVTATGGTMPYTYIWDSGSTAATATNLTAGNHDVTVTDMNGCTTMASVQLTEPSALTVSVDGTTTANCTSCDGTASITAGGGTPPYMFLWSNGNTNEDPTDLCSGGSNVTVTDANGCITTATATVANTSTLTVDNITIDNAISCNGASDGQATVTVTGGQVPYTYLWTGGSTDATATGLSAGTYGITVTDFDGCIAVDNINLTQPAGLLLLGNVLSHVSCNGDSDGSAEVQPIGGTMPYTYAWDNGETASPATMLNAGNHVVTVTDANGCTETTSVNITEPSVFTASVNLISDISCFGAGDGSAEALPSGGTMPYTFIWDNSETTATASSLDDGLHTVTVTDGNSCTATASVMITEPVVLTTLTLVVNEVSCFGGSDGSATATPSGGTMPYTYDWDNGETTATATNLDASMHSLTVTDQNGCTTTATVTTTEPTELTVTLNGTTTANCTSCDGTADITTSGGTGPYTYNWSNGSTDEDPADLCSGNNTITVTDANGCTATATAVVGNTSTLVVDNITADNNVSCNGFTDGQATATVSGGQMPYTYNWTGGSTDATATGLGAGNYDLTVTDADGCVAVDNVTITEPALLTGSAVEDVPVMCAGEATGEATVTAMGGTIPYTYTWDDGQTTATATMLTGGTHSITITDANSCEATTSVLINEPPTGVTITVDGQTPSNCSSCDGTASLTVSGGTPPYTYGWDNGNTSEDPTDLCTGFNTITVTDAGGCSQTALLNIGNTSTLVIDNVIADSDVSCFGFTDGAATVSVSGGQMPYTYQWSSGATDAMATGLGGGTESVTVTDGNGCTSAGSVDIIEPALLTATATEDQPATCNGGSDGSATVTPTGGTMPYTFAWDNTETDATATALNAGNHSVTVTDANGCTTQTTVDITEPAVLTATSAEDQSVTCFGFSDGAATVTGMGGTMPYTYSWDNGETEASATNLSGGNHSVTVTDANGCTTDSTIDITQPVIFLATATEDQSVLCNGGSTGQATTNPTGGTMPYTFAWGNGETTQTATGLDVGFHIVSINDANGCLTTAAVAINEPTVLIALALENTPVSCNGLSDGSATVTPSGGTMPYTFAWDNTETDMTATGLNAGNHSVTVTDANGCTFETTVDITEPATLTATATEDQPVSCNGGSDGFATVTPTGGTIPYTYAWDNTETDATATALNAGNHSVTVTDANGCTTQTTVDITEPAALTATAAEDQPVSCNGFSDGSATVTPTGGTMPYTFAWDNTETDATATALNAGNHSITVTDANGCTTQTTVDITEPALLSAATVEDQSVTCFGFSDGAATVTAMGGSMPYTYSWDNGETDASVTNLTGGNHGVTVTDANGCTTDSTIDITQPVIFLATATEDQSVLCNSESTGQATANPTGGTMPYTYGWDNGETTQTASGLDVGFHIVNINDANGCLTSAAVAINEPTVLIALALENTPVSCNGLSDGAATATPTGGTMPYIYAWDNTETDATATALNAGNHSITVTDANGCTFETTVDITEPAALTATATEDQPVSCNGLSDGSATVTPTGGTMPYTFVWDNTETDASATALNAGNHLVTVTDANGCTIQTTVDITEPIALTATATEDQPASCNGLSDGSATVTPSGGTMPYTYAWDNTETDATATALNAGNHSVTVTDANGCTFETTVDITEPAALIATATEDQPVSCNGLSDGAATVTPTGGTMPYTFVWDDTETDATATALNAGNHSITVTDANGCTTQTTVDITEPTALTATAAEDQPVSCNGLSDGSATVTPAGGTMPYTFVWDNAETDATATALNAGNHSVTVTDANGCTTQTTVDITEPATLTATATEDQPVSCNGLSDGAATVTPTGGTMPYTYAWDNTETDATATALNAGNHSVTVTDANGCTIQTTVDITEPAALTATATEDQPVSCNGLSDGSATVNALGGTMPYTYAWDNTETDATATALNAGNHLVTVTDANGCTIQTTVDITEPAALTATAAEDQPVSCNGFSDGSATVTPTGGTMPYTYTWDNTETDATATALNAGNHSITVTDANGCTTQTTVDITEPTALTATATEDQPVSCNGLSDGSATVTTTGGTMPYTYTWDNTETDATATALNAGNHSVTVTDANGCTTQTTVDITEPAALTATAAEDQSVSCNGLSDGSATVTPTGGTMPYTYAWDNTETDATATALNAGNHSVTVTDANGCTIQTTVDITEPALLTAMAAQTTGVSCNGLSDGSATATPSGGTVPYTYAWDNTETDATAAALNAGNHSVTVTDANGCTTQTTVAITEPAPLAAGMTAQPVSCFGFPDGQGMAVVSGGTPPYFYNWDNGEVANPAIFLTSGSHTVTVSDVNGCTLTASVAVGSPAPLVPNNISSTPTTCFGGNDGAALVGAAGGTPPYFFTWSDGQTGASATGLSAGVISVVIQDANGCSLPPINVTVGQPAQSIVVTASGTDPTCFGGDDGTATASASGGTPSYQFTWSNGAVGPTAFDLQAGTYTVTVADANGCEMTETVILGQPEMVDAEVSATGVLCFGDANGSIVVDTAFGGMGPYVFSLDGENYQTSQLFAGLTGGLYEVWVQDINGCGSSQQVLVDEPFELVVNLGADIEVVLGDSITLVAEVNTTDSLSYFWSPADYLSCITCENPVVFPLETTTYTLMVADSNGCSALDQITITVDKSRDVYIPNAFTPNGDGTNDIFMVYGNQGIAQIRMFRIFDRWGEMVFQGANFQPNDPAFGWDGRLKGKGLNPAVFVYFAEVQFVDGVTIMYKGDVTLLK